MSRAASENIPFSAVSSRSPVRAGEVTEAAWRDPPGEGGAGGEGHSPSPRSFAGEPGRGGLRSPPTPANEFSPWEHGPGLKVKPTPGPTRGGFKTARVWAGLRRERGENTPSAPAPHLEPPAGLKPGGVLSGGAPTHSPLLPGARKGSSAPPVLAFPRVSFLSPRSDGSRRPEAAGMGWRKKRGFGGRRAGGVSPEPCPAAAVTPGGRRVR